MKVDSTKRRLIFMESPFKGVAIYHNSRYLLLYPTTFDDQGGSVIALLLPDEVSGLKDFYVILRDLNSQNVDQMRLHFVYKGETEEGEHERTFLMLGNFLRLRIILGKVNYDSIVFLGRPVEEGKYNVYVSNKQYEVTVERFSPIIIQDIGTHDFTFEIIFKSENREIVSERFVLRQVVSINYYTSKHFNNRFYNAMVGSLLDYSYANKVKVYVYKGGVLKEIGSYNINLELFDKIVEEYKPRNPDEYIIFEGTKECINVDTKIAERIFPEIVKGYEEKVRPLYIVGLQGEYVGGRESLFINMFLVPKGGSIEDYIDIVKREFLVSDVGYYKVSDVTVVRQGDVTLIVSPIVTKSYLQELLDAVNEGNAEKALDLFCNYREYHVDKIRNVQKMFLSRLGVEYLTEYMREKGLSTIDIFNKAIHSIQPSDLYPLNVTYFIPMRIKNSVGRITYFHNLEGLIKYIMYVKKAKKGKKIIQTFLSDLGKMRGLERYSYPEVLIRILMGMVYVRLLPLLGSSTVNVSLDKVIEASLKSFNYVKVDKVREIAERFRELAKDIYSSFGESLEKYYLLDIALIIRDAYFLKLLGINHEQYYITYLDEKRFEKVNNNLRKIISDRKEGNGVRLTAFRQYVLNDIIYELPLEDEHEFDLKDFLRELFGDICVKLMDTKLPPRDFLGTPIFNPPKADIYGNVPLPIIVYTRDRTATVGNKVFRLGSQFFLYSLTTPIFVVEDGFRFRHRGHRIEVEGDIIRLVHEGHEHPDIILTLDYQDLKLELNEEFVEKFNSIFKTNYSSPQEILNDLVEGFKEARKAVISINIQPMVIPSVIAPIYNLKGIGDIGLVVKDREIDPSFIF